MTFLQMKHDPQAGAFRFLVGQTEHIAHLHDLCIVVRLVYWVKERSSCEAQQLYSLTITAVQSCETEKRETVSYHLHGPIDLF